MFYLTTFMVESAGLYALRVDLGPSCGSETSLLGPPAYMVFLQVCIVAGRWFWRYCVTIVPWLRYALSTSPLFRIFSRLPHHLVMLTAAKALMFVITFQLPFLQSFRIRLSVSLGGQGTLFKRPFPARASHILQVSDRRRNKQGAAGND